MAHMYPDEIAPLDSFEKTADGHYRVKKGQFIGFLGNSGASSPAHLHFEFINQKRSARDSIKLFGLEENDFKTDSGRKLYGSFPKNSDTPPADDPQPVPEENTRAIEGTYNLTLGSTNDTRAGYGDATEGWLTISQTDSSPHKSKLSLYGIIYFNNDTYLTFGGTDTNFNRTEESSRVIYIPLPIVINCDIELRRYDTGYIQMLLTERTKITNITLATKTITFSKADSASSASKNIKARKSLRTGTFQINK